MDTTDMLGPSPEQRDSIVRRCAALVVRGVLDAVFVLPLFLLAILARAVPKRIEVGIGPVPSINNAYHKQALERFGHKAEIFVDSMWYYTSTYDYAPTFLLGGPQRALIPYLLAARCFVRYRVLYTYFDGGPLRPTAWLFLLEPALLRLAGIKTVIMGFGADVHELSRSRDRYFVHAMSRDYPSHRFLRRRIARKIDLWTSWADHIVAGVDWVRYLHYWDTLCLGHFAIDADKVRGSAPTAAPGDGPLRVLHAPNHRAIKGTRFLLQAVDELKAEGVEIDLVLVEGMPNDELLEEIAGADVVVDQLIIGWYAMFAIESMALETACITYLDPDLVKLFTRAGLIAADECPLISATPEDIKEALRACAADKPGLVTRGARGRAFIERHHSLEAIGRMFDAIQKRVLS